MSETMVQEVGTGSASPLAPFTKARLPNGLRVIVKEVHTTPIVAVYFWCGVGSVDEPPELGGISHFFEHMFFKGTEKRTVGQMDAEIKALGGYNNAFTSREYTAYYVVVPSEHFATAFDILYDAMRHSIFAPEEIKKERKVVKEEINRKEDTPGQKLFDLFTERLFAGTPYAQPVLGTDETLDGIHREDFLSYLRNYYGSHNTTVVVVGDVMTGPVLDAVETATRDWRAPENGELRRPEFHFTPQDTIRQHIVPKDANQEYWLMGFPNAGWEDPELMYTLDVASTMLGGGKSSRLYQRLVEREGLVASVSAWIWPLVRVGVFGIDAEFPPENHERVAAIVLEEVGRLGTEPIGADELKKAKTQLITQDAYGNETNSSIARTLGRYETIRTAEEALDYTAKIDAVTAYGIQRAVRDHLRLDAYTACAIVPAADAPDDTDGGETP